MASSTISYLWRDPHAPTGFRTGVSLHGHTNQSKETLDFSGELRQPVPGDAAFAVAIGAARGGDARDTGELCGQLLDAADDPQAGLRPGERADREVGPGTDGLHHRSRYDPGADAAADGASARRIPVSVEWSAPYGTQSFHLGVHNLPSARATEWMETLRSFTANPSDARLTEILAALNAEPNVLVVFNHPCGIFT